MILHFLLEGQIGLKHFAHYLCTKFSNCQIYCIILVVTEVHQTSGLLHTVLFLTDSVLRVLFAYFDESMASIGGYEP